VRAGRSSRLAIGAAALATAPWLAAPALAQGAQGPLPENRAIWIGAGDYPRDAYLQGLEGTVRFAVSVDQDGKVRRCVVRQSSGVSALDAATCRLILDRARFKPALDGRGRKTPGVYASTVRWAINWISP
jgi:TonB family protein